MRVEKFTTGFLKTNTYVVGPDVSNEVLVIDPGRKIAPVLRYLAQEELEVTAIVNTHRHWDHIGGNRGLKKATGAPILIHEADAERISGFSFWSLLLRGRPHPSPPADRLLRDGDKIAAGSYSFQVIHTPGHTPGSICLKYKKFLFTGDTLMAGAVGRTKDKNDSWKLLSESIQKKLYVLSDDIACHPGHGPKTSIERERKTNIFVRYSPEQIENWLFRPPHNSERTKERDRVSKAS